MPSGKLYSLSLLLLINLCSLFTISMAMGGAAENKNNWRIALTQVRGKFIHTLNDTKHKANETFSALKQSVPDLSSKQSGRVFRNLEPHWNALRNRALFKDEVQDKKSFALHITKEYLMFSLALHMGYIFIKNAFILGTQIALPVMPLGLCYYFSEKYQDGGFKGVIKDFLNIPQKISDDV